MEERRRAVRVPRPLELECVVEGSRLQAQITNVSEAGLSIGTSLPLEVGAVIHLRFSLPDNAAGLAIRGKARVVWSEPGLGVGVEFQELSHQDRERIRFFVAAALFGATERGSW